MHNLLQGDGTSIIHLSPSFAEPKDCPNPDPQTLGTRKRLQNCELLNLRPILFLMETFCADGSPSI